MTAQYSGISFSEHHGLNEPQIDFLDHTAGQGHPQQPPSNSFGWAKNAGSQWQTVEAWPADPGDYDSGYTPPSGAGTEKRSSRAGRRRGWRWPRVAWGLEISLLVLSSASFAATVIVLAVENGTVLGNWTFYFSLNTVISVLGTISRASLAAAVASCIAQEKWNWYCKGRDHLYMFDRLDNASRGVVGSIKLLRWLKFR